MVRNVPDITKATGIKVKQKNNAESMFSVSIFIKISQSCHHQCNM